MSFNPTGPLMRVVFQDSVLNPDATLDMWPSGLGDCRKPAKGMHFPVLRIPPPPTDLCVCEVCGLEYLPDWEQRKQHSGINPNARRATCSATCGSQWRRRCDRWMR